jgi:putative tryptophan/tyrosine transport system substrate-binding protein
MRRRDLIAVSGGAVMAWPLRAVAQKQGIRVIGLLSPFTRAEAEPWHQAFRQGLQELGWTEGDKVRFEYRYADGHNERLPDLAADLVRLTPDVIVVTVNSDAGPAMKATKTIPIVMAGPGDPVETGLIASLAHPGGNVTGLTNIDTDLAAKRLQLLKEVAPDISRVAVLWDPRIAFSARAWREIQDPARQLGISLRSLELHSNGEVDATLARAVEAHDEGLFALQGPIFVVNEKRIADFAVKHRLPSISHLPEFVRYGGLLSYGADRADLFRRAATYVDKILKGARPADLPVEQASKFQLVVNLKTAKALGLAVPQSILTRADEVIE